MGFLALAKAFFTSKLGVYCLLALAVMAALGALHRHGTITERHKWEHKWEQRDAADAIATDKAQAAATRVKAEQDRVTADLQQQLVFQRDRVPLVVTETKIKEVVREVEKKVNASCTITDDFLRLRNISFDAPPTRTTPMASQATPVASGTDPGLKAPVKVVEPMVVMPRLLPTATEVAAADGRALGQCRQAIEDLTFNLHQWDDWYEAQKPIWDRYREAIQGINADKGRKATAQPLQGPTTVLADLRAAAYAEHPVAALGLTGVVP